MADHSQEIPYEEIETWFLARVKELGIRGFGRNYGIDHTVVSRNLKRIRKNKDMASPFTKRLAKIMYEERAEELRQQCLAEQAAEVQRQGEAVGGILFAVRSASQQREAADRIEADRKRRQQEAADRIEADRKRRQRDLEDAFIRSIKIWEGRFRAAGYMVGEQMVAGDANELLLAGISDLNYIDIGVAAVALLPDDCVIWRDKPVSFFREGVPYTLRLQPTAVSEGQPRPAMIGNVPASTVYYDPLPSEIWHYGKKGSRIAAKWRELTDAYGHLATGTLPRVVHPETVSGFERLIQIEEQSGYIFEDSCLGPDARDRLKRLQRRAILPVIGITTKDMIWGASKSATAWCRSTGWKWLAGLIAVLLAMAAVTGILWLAIELSKWFWSIMKANQAPLMLGGVLLVGLGLVVWWVWPKQNDHDGAFAARFGLVTAFAILAVFVVIGLIIAAPAIKEVVAAAQSFNQFDQTIHIP